MSKTFRAWKIDEPLLLPVTVQEFVAKDHLARFLLSVVEEELDLGGILSCYSSVKGQPLFHPTMMTTLLHGDPVAALKLAQEREQWCDLAAGVLVDAMQAHERIEDEQARLQARDGLGEIAAVGLHVEADAIWPL